MNTEVAQENGIHENDWVRVFSVNGRDALFTVKLTDHVRREELYAPIHYIECNRLTPSCYDPYSKEPDYKGAVVRFEKCQEEPYVSNKN